MMFPHGNNKLVQALMMAAAMGAHASPPFPGMPGSRLRARSRPPEDPKPSDLELLKEWLERHPADKERLRKAEEKRARRGRG